jgi:long-chain acyl-CoA synthetase
LDAAELETARIALYIPIVSAYSHPLVCGPITSSHPLDLQSFPTSAESVTHVGPPSPNIEAKLVEVDSSIEQGGDPTGFVCLQAIPHYTEFTDAFLKLSIRGPTISKSLGQSTTDSEGWLATGQRARIQANGTFKLL